MPQRRVQRCPKRKGDECCVERLRALRPQKGRERLDALGSVLLDITRVVGVQDRLDVQCDGQRGEQRPPTERTRLCEEREAHKQRPKSTANQEIAECLVLEPGATGVHVGRGRASDEQRREQRARRFRHGIQRRSGESGGAVAAEDEFGYLVRKQHALDERQVGRALRVLAVREVEERVHQVAGAVNRQRDYHSEQEAWQAENVVDLV